MPDYRIHNDSTPRKKKKPDLLWSKDELKNMLEGDVLTITFDKIDGNERVMKCTLLAEYLPVKDTAKLLVEQNNRKENSDTLSVWDTEVNGWRSFRVDSVRKVL